MRNVPQAALDLIAQTKEVGVRATFRKTLPAFNHTTIGESISLSGTSWVDAYVYGTGILRVTSVNNVLYTQYVPDIHGTWPAWVNTGISLYAGSVPAVDDGYIWYQKPNTQIAYRYYATFSTEVLADNFFPNNPAAIAPIGNTAFAMWKLGYYTYQIAHYPDRSSISTLVGPTSLPRFDAVSIGGKNYLYSMDRDAGRVVEIVHTSVPGTGMESFGIPKPVIPIDAIDDVYGFKLGYAGVVDSKVVVTGLLTRTSDDTPVAMEIYTAGPSNFSIGNEIFIQNDFDARGKMMRIGNEFVVVAPGHMWTAKATTLFGGTGHSDLELTTSDLAAFTLTEAEGRSTNLDIDLSTDLAHSALAVGSELVLEMAYNNNWTKLATAVVNSDMKTTLNDGSSRVVSGVGKSVKKLSQWSPDQGVYIPSQARMYDSVGNMTQVLRAGGQWQRISEEGALMLKDLNSPGILYSASRASRGGTMRAVFQRPNDDYYHPVFGVGVNYYRETAAEAAARLDMNVSELTENDYGLNGIFALYSDTNGENNLPGFEISIFKDGSSLPMGRTQVTLAADTWYWVELSYVEGFVTLNYKKTTDARWLPLFKTEYDKGFLPWATDTLGRGAIYVNNGVPETDCYPITANDKTLGVESNSNFPSSGTLLVDGEEITYSAKSNAPHPGDWTGYEAKPTGWNVSPHLYPIYNYAMRWENDPNFSGHCNAMFISPGTWDMSNYWQDAGDVDVYGDDYTGLAVVFLPTRKQLGKTQYLHAGGRTCRVTGYSEYLPREWIDGVTPAYAPGWTANKGNLAKGSWGPASGPDSTICRLYTDEDVHQWLGYGDYPWEGIPEGASTNILGYVALKPAFHISARGSNNTVATSHDVSTAKYKPASLVLVDLAASFSQDEDQSMEDALSSVVTLAGGKATCRAKVDETHAFTANEVLPVSGSHKNYIATFDLPVLADLTGIGMCFRGSSAWAWNNTLVWPKCTANDGYVLEIWRSQLTYYLDLYGPNKVLLDSVAISIHTAYGSFSPLPYGTIKISVQDEFFSVWLNGRFLHGFRDATHATGTNIAFYSRMAASSKIHLSELDDLLADIVVGTRGNGMSVLSELLADRGIQWRDEPDGSMFFYRSRGWVGDLPDVVCNVVSNETDSVLTRMRAEGMSISEIMDTALMSQYGNRFATINARFANNILETRKEAQGSIDEEWRNARTKRYSLVVHPGLQPGDAANFTDAPNTQSAMVVRSQSITVGFSGNNFVADMHCDVVPYSR